MGGSIPCTENSFAGFVLFEARALFCVKLPAAGGAYCVRILYIESKELKLQFDPMSHIWECREDEETARSADEEVIGIVIDWLHDEKRFEGTASELLEILHDALPCELRPNILSRWLNKHKGMLKANGVSYMLRRTRDSRTICLSCDGNDANDDISWSGAASKIPSPSSQPSQAAALPGVSRQRPGTGRCPPLP